MYLQVVLLYEGINPSICHMIYHNASFHMYHMISYDAIKRVFVSMGAPFQRRCGFFLPCLGSRKAPLDKLAVIWFWKNELLVS